MLTITDLCKTYAEKKSQNIPALDHVNLSIGSGMFGLLGPNGAGKSSLMRTIATLQKPDAGTITFAGENIIEHPEFMRKQLGYLPQDYGVYPGVSAYELLDYLAKLKGVTDGKKRNAQIDKLLTQVNLTQHKSHAVSRFSGGMKQRFGIAQALLGDPKMLIVDEPTAGLDPEERNRFHNLLVEISRDKVVLLSTHIVEDVSHLCPNMAILAAGKIVKQGSPAQLIEQVKGKIWQIKTSKANLEGVIPKTQVISQRLFAGEATIHVYSEHQPSPDFHQVSPDLEDAYFAALHCNTSELQDI
ncbi:ABC transporter ATP-binding protein [Thalassotalea sediminis]|uniref:ABC transporter ATP-binding protein n=1 Tax=Thalassotalea sediminis TaxID=1759089 RepID=UPI002573D955|nr:ABC transporter ATP-binding protein [Thalassotalea sediminis]